MKESFVQCESVRPIAVTIKLQYARFQREGARQKARTVSSTTNTYQRTIGAAHTNKATTKKNAKTSEKLDSAVQYGERGKTPPFHSKNAPIWHAMATGDEYNR